MLALYWRNFVVPYRELLIKGIVCFLVASTAGLAAPIVIKVLIDDALSNGNIKYLHIIIASILALYFIRGLFSFVHGHCMARAGNDMVAKTRHTMFCRLQLQDYAYFVNTPTGEIMSLFTNDLLLLQQAVTVGISDCIVESINLLAIMCIMIYFDWELALVTFVTIPFIILAIGHFNKKIAILGDRVEQTLAKVTDHVHHSLRSLNIIQSYVREEFEYKRFSGQIHNAASEYLKLQHLNAILIPLVEFLAALGLTIIIWFGGREVINGNLTIGGMFAFLIYIINLPAPIRKISEAFTKLKLGMVAWHRITSLNEQPRSIVDGTICLKKIEGKVEFRNVAFNYSKNMGILKDINISAAPNEIVAIAGPSGAGKSSFANLLLRFYDPADGGIFIDGIDLRTVKVNDLRRNIGFIQQQPTLFNTSILDNIKYGQPDASFNQVVQAAKQANAHEFITKLPQGYNTLVGECGSSLSGGQRQRIALARALILEPAILLLDEPTASLDAKAERQVIDAIRSASYGRTTFMITHRLSTIVNSDKVVYLANGQIVEAGYHSDLINKQGVYARAVQVGEIQGLVNEQPI